jgi:hypothetical protein
MTVSSAPGTRDAPTINRKAYCTISSCSRDSKRGSNFGFGRSLVLRVEVLWLAPGALEYRPTEVVAIIADRLRRADSKDRFFEESAAGLMRRAAVLVKARDEAAWNLEKIWRMANAGPDEGLLEEVDRTNPQVSAAASFFEDEWPKLEERTKSSIMATLHAWYTTITGHPDTLKWAMTLAGKSDVDVTGALRGKRIGILAPAHRYGEAGPVVMALLKARIFAAIRDRADKGMAKDETPSCWSRTKRRK